MDSEKSTFICEGCGAAYEPRRNLDGSAGKTKHRLCSVKCARSVYAKKAYAKRGHQPVRIERECAHCNCVFIATQSIIKHCSAKCRDAAKRKRVKQYPAMQESRRARDAKRRALKRASAVERIEPLKAFERDGWVCHLCGVKTLKSKRGTLHPRAPELEHIVALADGGAHTWGNVACACSACNRAKGARSFGQLRLGFAA